MSEKRDGFVVVAHRMAFAADDRLTSHGLMVGVDEANVCFLLTEEAARTLQRTMQDIDERVVVMTARLHIGEPLDVEKT